MDWRCHLWHIAYTYDDTTGDTSLSQFNINKTPSYVFSVINDIRAINPYLKVHVLPWSPVSTLFLHYVLQCSEWRTNFPNSPVGWRTVATSMEERFWLSTQITVSIFGICVWLMPKRYLMSTLWNSGTVPSQGRARVPEQRHSHLRHRYPGTSSSPPSVLYTLISLLVPNSFLPFFSHLDHFESTCLIYGDSIRYPHISLYIHGSVIFLEQC